MQKLLNVIKDTCNVMKHNFRKYKVSIVTSFLDFCFQIIKKKTFPPLYKRGCDESLISLELIKKSFPRPPIAQQNEMQIDRADIRDRLHENSTFNYGLRLF